MPSTANRLYSQCDSRWSLPCAIEGRRSYRYFLRRRETKSTGRIEPEKPVCAFILLNPSTADEVKDDPTVAKCRRHAEQWGFGEVIVLNAFAYRATNPKAMRAQADPVGPLNDETILTTCQVVAELGGTLVCGWGNHGQLGGRSDALRTLLLPFDTRAFKICKTGEPSHPLYLPMSTALVTYP